MKELIKMLLFLLILFWFLLFFLLLSLRVMFNNITAHSKPEGLSSRR